MAVEMNLILRSMRAKTVIGSSHQGFTRDKLCLISFPLAEEERAQHVLCPVFGKDFYTVSHSILPAQLERDGMDG